MERDERQRESRGKLLSAVIIIPKIVGWSFLALMVLKLFRMYEEDN